MLKIAICDDSKVDVEQLETAFGALCGYRIDYDVYFSAVELLKYTLKHKENYHLYIFAVRHRNAGHDRAGTGKGNTAGRIEGTVCVSDRLLPVCHGRV